MLGSILLQAGVAHESFTQFLAENIQVFLSYTGFANATPGHFIMLLVGLAFIFLAIKYEFEPMLLIPIGFGILIGNIPFKDAGLQLGIYEEGSVFNILYQGVRQGWYPPLIFLGIGAMTDCPVWYLRCLHHCPSDGIRPEPSSCHRYHWWCGRPDGYLPFVQVGA